MDIIRTMYKELFNVKLVHKAYSPASKSKIFNEVKIVPDKNTQALFNRFGIGYRCLNNTIVCFIRSELVTPPAAEPKKPYVSLDGAFKVRFLLTASSGFLKNTYVVAAGSKEVYHFTNKINNVQSSSKYITKIIENYNASKSYNAGTVVNNAGQSCVTLQAVNAAGGILITNLAYWKKVLPSEQVVNNADLEDKASVKPEENCFAVIDVYSTGTTNATYDLFGNGQRLLSPVYVIPFKSKI
jgi:hypothetical protein